MYGCCENNLKYSIVKLSVILNLTTCRRDCVCFLCVGGKVVIAQQTTSFLTTGFLFLQPEAIALDSTYTDRSHHNQETRSEEDFTFTRSKEFPLKRIFPQSTEQTIYNAEENNENMVSKKKGYSENSKFKQTSAGKQSATSENMEEEPMLESRDLLLWALEKYQI